MSESLVTLSLIDFKSHSQDLAQLLLKNKLREPSKKIFSLKFDLIGKYELTSLQLFYSKIIRQGLMKLLMVGTGNNMVFFDLESRKELFKYDFGQTICYFEIHDNDLLISLSPQKLMKLDFQKVLNRESIEECKIWENDQFLYIWGFAVRRQSIYVCDYDNSEMVVIDYHTGKKMDQVKVPKMEQGAAVAFTPFNEMITSGLDYVELYKLNEKNEWISKKKLSPHVPTTMGYYSICYEEASQRIFVSDSDNKILIFDRELNLLQTFESKNKGCYGIDIDSSTGYCYLCSNNPPVIEIYK